MTKQLKINILSILVVLTFNGVAQIWCYPGAEWYYSRSYISGNGFAKHTYVGEVIFQNKNCQKINSYIEEYNYLSQTVQTNALFYYTYTNNNVVYLYHSDLNVFDTLYNFNAAIGDAWYFPYNSNCGYVRWQVLDTGHKVIQGQNLKWLKINRGVPENDTIYERIGNLSYFGFDIKTSCYVDYPLGGPLRCYSDQQILNYKKYSNNCDYYIVPSGLKAIDKISVVNIKPNPTSDFLEIAVDNNNCDYLEIFDINGKLLLKQPMTLENFKVNIRELTSGLYFISLHSQTGSIKTGKFIKE